MSGHVGKPGRAWWSSHWPKQVGGSSAATTEKLLTREGINKCNNMFASHVELPA